jgi:hypothetical protein
MRREAWRIRLAREWEVLVVRAGGPGDVVVVELPFAKEGMLEGLLADGEVSLASLEGSWPLYVLGESPKNMGGPYCSSLEAPEGLPLETCGVVGSMALSVAERFSTGAAETDRAKARMAPWMEDLMLVVIVLLM